MWRGDAVRLTLPACAAARRNFPVVYETITDHSRRILACTKGYPGSRNDKTISRFDSAFNRIRKEEPYISQEFHLRSKDGVLKTYKGAYLLVDGGYHKWRQLMCPMKQASGK